MPDRAQAARDPVVGGWRTQGNSGGVKRRRASNGCRAATDGKRAEISVFRRALHYRLQTPQRLAGREFGADPGCSERYAPDIPK
ncbi:DUF1534 domain-containing protein [Burkholderia ambifaria]